MAPVLPTSISNVGNPSTFYNALGEEAGRHVAASSRSWFSQSTVAHRIVDNEPDLDPRSQTRIIRPPVTELTAENTEPVVLKVRDGSARGLITLLAAKQAAERLALRLAGRRSNISESSARQVISGSGIVSRLTGSVDPGSSAAFEGERHDRRGTPSGDEQDLAAVHAQRGVKDRVSPAHCAVIVNSHA